MLGLDSCKALVAAYMCLMASNDNGCARSQLYQRPKKLGGIRCRCCCRTSAEPVSPLASLLAACCCNDFTFSPCMLVVQTTMAAPAYCWLRDRWSELSQAVHCLKACNLTVHYQTVPLACMKEHAVVSMRHVRRTASEPSTDIGTQPSC